MLQAFTDIVKVGVNFIPGAGEVNAVKAAVQGAKSMLENALGSGGFDSVGVFSQAPPSFTRKALTLDAGSGSVNRAGSQVPSLTRVLTILSPKCQIRWVRALAASNRISRNARRCLLCLGNRSVSRLKNYENTARYQ
jgi:hypothetical protein